MLGIKTGTATCKAHVLPAVLSLQLLSEHVLQGLETPAWMSSISPSYMFNHFVWFGYFSVLTNSLVSAQPTRERSNKDLMPCVGHPAEM